MKLDELRDLLDDCCNDFSFVIDGKPSGIIPEVVNYKRTYHVWYGSQTKDFHELSDVLNADIFGGRSLSTLCENLDFQIS